MAQYTVDAELPARQFYTQQENPPFTTCTEIPVEGLGSPAKSYAGASSLGLTQTVSGGRQEDELTSAPSVFNGDTASQVDGQEMSTEEVEQAQLQKRVEAMKQRNDILAAAAASLTENPIHARTAAAVPSIDGLPQRIFTQADKTSSSSEDPNRLILPQDGHQADSSNE